VASDKAKLTLKIAARNDDYLSFQRIIRSVNGALLRIIDETPNLRDEKSLATISHGNLVPAFRCLGKHNRTHFIEQFLADKEIRALIRERYTIEGGEPDGSQWISRLAPCSDWCYVDIATGAIKGGHMKLFDMCIEKFCRRDLKRMGIEARQQITSAAIKMDNFQIASEFGLRAYRWDEGGLAGDFGRNEILGGSLLVEACMRGARHCIEGFGAEFVRRVRHWKIHENDADKVRPIYLRIR
jgi:hypothetical protein